MAKGTPHNPVRGGIIKGDVPKGQQELLDRIIAAGLKGYSLKAGSNKDMMAEKLARRGLVKVTGVGIDNHGDPTNLWGPT